MSRENTRFMRLLVFFDLPTLTKSDKRAYVLFRRFLLQDGYDMIQWSVYGRIINSSEVAEKHMKRLRGHLPAKGSVRCMKVTEKQFVNMEILVGTLTIQEEKVGMQQVLFL